MFHRIDSYHTLTAFVFDIFVPQWICRMLVFQGTYNRSPIRQLEFTHAARDLEV